jgi:hypothetical protein
VFGNGKQKGNGKFSKGRKSERGLEEKGPRWWSQQMCPYTEATLQYTIRDTKFYCYNIILYRTTNELNNPMPRHSNLLPTAGLMLLKNTAVDETMPLG